MQIICKRGKLLEGMQTVKSAVGTKSTLPVLSNVLLETQEKRLSLMATDLEIGIKCFVEAEVLEPGAVTIPAMIFSEIISQLPSEELSLKVNQNNQMTISSGQSKFDLKGLSKEDYPSITEFEVDKEFFIERKLLNGMINKTIFSISDDETRYILCGTYFCIEDGKIKMVTTDGRRLSCIVKNIEINKEEKVKTIIPKKAFTELNRILSQLETENKVRIRVGKNQISFVIDNVVLFSRLIEGSYPDYNKVIPENNEIKFKIKTEELLNVIKRIAILTTDTSTSVDWLLKDNKLIVSIQTTGVGEAKDVVGVDYSKNEMQIKLNPQFVIDVLKNIDCAEVCIELSQSLKPCLIRPVSDDDYLSIIMPMKK